MRFLSSTFSLLFLFSGCASSSGVYQEAQEKWKKRQEYWLTQMSHITCDRGKGSTFSQCDTETEKFHSSKLAIKSLVCTKGMSKKKCNDTLRVTLIANLLRRYPYANWEDVYASCERPCGHNPDDQLPFWLFEHNLRNSNNKFVRDQGLAELDQLQQQADLDAEKAHKSSPLRVIGTILQGAGQGLMHAQDNTVNCTNLGSGMYSCTNQGRTYSCTSYGNSVRCQ